MADQLQADGVAIKASILRVAVSIFDVLTKLGKEVHGKDTQQVLCPNPQHPERRPSARAYADSNHVHCFGCGRTWDPVQVVALVQGTSLESAVEWLSLHFQLPDLGSMAPTVIGTIIKAQTVDFTALVQHVSGLILRNRERMGAQTFHRCWLAFDSAVVGHHHKQMDAEDFEAALRSIGEAAQVQA